MKKNFVEALIGAAVLVVAAWFFMFTYKTTEFGKVEGYSLSARFDRVDGLNVGGDVRIGGIKVGTIIAQEVDLETYQAVLELSIDPRVRLPADTSAKIRSESLLGGRYLSLEPGGDDEYLGDGDEIEFTQGSIDVIDLIGREIFSADDDQDKDGDEK
ncbi:MAG: outer membrane lipid asymmetry maintenance protein MlaD [Proteobacteria bacterium]|nr:outer membrane lipid asymmetry maintenance protein MlaD [Pseudomonadota bacterium]